MPNKLQNNVLEIHVGGVSKIKHGHTLVLQLVPSVGEVASERWHHIVAWHNAEILDLVLVWEAFLALCWLASRRVDVLGGVGQGIAKHRRNYAFWSAERDVDGPARTGLENIKRHEELFRVVFIIWLGHNRHVFQLDLGQRVLHVVLENNIFLKNVFDCSDHKLGLLLSEFHNCR
ncbi:hypothetical protein OGATHE_003418 [Ogataea polymorpha]|uniref:Uncharacterized protein n=1 Tax=Ogataea polymorpha TaxID=460523 RepID=A0A9P8P2Y9_9ASCO|nr:hypothetical protein OGATHE_003418 [Ogataea polymorpha]